IAPLEHIWADTTAPHAASAAERSWQSSCLKRLGRASRKLGQQLPIFASYRTYVRERTIGLEEESEDPSYSVETGDAEEPGVETGWPASVERGLSRQHRGKAAEIRWGLRIYGKPREAVYAAFRAAVDSCLDELPRPAP